MMKFNFFVIILVIFVVACGQAPNENEETHINNNEQETDTVGTIRDFFPFEENVTFVITSEDMPEINQEIFTTFINGNFIQQRVTAENIDILNILEISDNTLKQVFSFNEYTVFSDWTNNFTPNMDLIILQEPLSLGNFWDNNMGGISTITDVNVPVSTPAGNFTNTIQVTTIFNNGDHSVSYFAHGHGMVSDSYTTTFQETTVSVTQHLSEVRQGGIDIFVPVFFPDENLIELEVEMVQTTINTNQNFVYLFNDLLPQSIPNLYNTSINNITLNVDEDYIIVDFSQNFLEIEMGASFESMLLESLANTFGFFYGVTNFRITLDGNIYESGHFLFEDNQFIRVEQ